MKNLHIIPTDKPSRLWFYKQTDILLTGLTVEKAKDIDTQHIYITSDEELNKDTKPCWCLDTKNNSVNYYQGALPLHNYIGYKKIILSTDQDLDGVQSIDDEFLKWFVKNPSCEEVKVKDAVYFDNIDWISCYKLKIVIPKEPKLLHQQIIDAVGGEDRFRKICKIEPNRDPLEEAAHKMLIDYGILSIGQSVGALEVKKLMVKMAKWQQEQDKDKFSEEEMLQALNIGFTSTDETWEECVEFIKEQFKKE